MKPVRTETTNAVYTLEGCQDLPVTCYINDRTNEPGVESVWKLSPEDIKRIQKTGKIYLYIQGNIVPPVLLTTESVVYFKFENKGNIGNIAAVHPERKEGAEDDGSDNK